MVPVTKLRIAISVNEDALARELAGELSTISASTKALDSSLEGRVEVVYVMRSQPLTEFDGLVFPGGSDVHPEFYGRPDLVDKVSDTDRKHDRFEIDLARSAMERHIPLLGLCRGMQVLNVVAGGTLTPRLSRAEEHFSEAAASDSKLREVAAHPLRVKPGSKLWSVFERDTIEVNSIHKGGPDLLGEGLIATAWAPDGEVEALEGEGPAWLHGVQFHPEDLCRSNPRWLHLFRDFLQATER